MKLPDLVEGASLSAFDALLLLSAAGVGTLYSWSVLGAAAEALANAAFPPRSNSFNFENAYVFLFAFGMGVLLVLGALVVLLLWIFGAAGPGRRSALRLSLLLLVVPTLASIAWHGGVRRWLDPSIEQYERQRAEKLALEQRLRASNALAIERETAGVRITNLSGETLQLQVAFLERSRPDIVPCTFGRSNHVMLDARPSGPTHIASPPHATDQELRLAAAQSRLFAFKDARDAAGTTRGCVFKDFAVWAWNDKGEPVFLNENASLF